MPRTHSSHPRKFFHNLRPSWPGKFPMKFSMPRFPALMAFLRRNLCESRCEVCGTVCHGSRQDVNLCAQCAHALKALEKGSFCPWCGQILPRKDARRFLCEDCALNPPPWEEIHLLGSYENILRDLLIAFKFHSSLAAGHLVGTLLARSMPENFQSTPFLLVPVPLSTERLQERGFNQSLELARPVAQKFSFEIAVNALTRRRHTTAQHELSFQKRRRNIQGAFRAFPDKIKNRHIMLCDDIMTTGSTMREAAKTLHDAGAKSISVLIAARTPKFLIDPSSQTV